MRVASPDSPALNGTISLRLRRLELSPRDLGGLELSRHVARGGEHVAVAGREHHDVAGGELDELAVQEAREARPFHQEVVGDHVVRVRHQHVGDLAGGRGQVRPLRAQLHLEEHGAGQADDGEHVGKCVHGGLCAGGGKIPQCFPRISASHYHGMLDR